MSPSLEEDQRHLPLYREMIGVMRTNSRAVSEIRMISGHISLTFVPNNAPSAFFAAVNPALLSAETTLLKVVAAIGSDQLEGFRGTRLLVVQQGSVQGIAIVIDVDLGLEKGRKSLPNFLVSERPRIDIEQGVWRIFRHLS